MTVWQLFFALVIVTGNGPIPWANFGGAPDQALTQGMYANWFAWDDGCVADKTYIPLVHGHATPDDLAQLNNSPCNDGRPAIAFNEPDRYDQDNTSPEDAADTLHAFVSGGWRGPVYAGNVEIETPWLDRMIEVYASRYGSRVYPSKYVPVAWGVHVYANFQTPGWELSLANMTDADLRRIVNAQGALLDAFIAKRRSEGNSTEIAITEMGGLGRWRPTDDQAAYFERLARLMQLYDDMLRARRQYIDGWFWYSSYSGEPGTPWHWPYSDLRTPQGLTPVGEMWRALASKDLP